MNAHQLIAHVASAFDLTSADLIGPSRTHQVSLARQAAAWVLRRATPLSLQQIGRVLGGRDHTTIIHAIAQAERRCVADPAYAAQLRGLLPQRPMAARSQPDRAGSTWWIAQARERWEVLAA